MSRFKKVYEKVREKLNEGADTEGMFGDKTGFPKGMKPVGDDGFVATQDGGKFDPRDCSNPRNATSPWCGYNPVTPQPIGVDVSLNLNQCGGYITVTPIMFIEFPPMYAGYLRKECREDYQEENDRAQHSQKALDPSQTIVPPPNLFPPTPAQDPPRLSPTCWYLISLGYVAVGRTGRFETQKGMPFTEVNGLELRAGRLGKTWAITQGGATLTFYADGGNAASLGGTPSLPTPAQDAYDTWYWGQNYNVYVISDDPRDHRVTRGAADYYTTNTYGSRVYDTDNYSGWQKWNTSANPYGADRDPSLRSVYPRTWEQASDDNRRYAEAWWMEVEYGLIAGISNKMWNSRTDLVGGKSIGMVFAGTGANLARYFAESIWTNGILIPKKPTVSYFISEIYELPCDNGLAWRNPPWEEDCMRCCCDGNSQNNKKDQDVSELLKIAKEINKKLGSFPREIELYDDDANKPKRQTKKVKVQDLSEGILRNQLEQNKILKTVGIEEFQIEFPDTLIEPRNNSVLGKVWNFFRPNKTRKINSIPQLIIWQIEQMSALAGQWHQYIEYEDKDGKGKSTKKEVVLVDPATTMRELFKNQIAIIQTLAVMNDVGLKNLQQTTEGSLMTVEALKRVTDIQDYLDYNTTETKGELPVKISPGEKTDTLEKYLKDSKLAYKWDDWTPENGQSLQEQLQDIKLILNNLLANGPGES